MADDIGETPVCIDRHRDRFEDNPRMKVIYRNWDKRDEDDRAQILREAEAWLDQLSKGKTV